MYLRHLFTRSLPTLVLVAAVASLTGCAVWRIGQAKQLLKDSEPFKALPAQATASLLVVGDSTAVGTGASTAADSVAGLIAHDNPRLKIVNRAQDGARLADVARQLERDGDIRFDAVLVQAGANDVMRFATTSDMERDVARVVDLALLRARTVVVMPSGNVGNAPFFFAPLSWVMSARSRTLHRIVREAAAARGALYVNLYKEKAVDPFVHQPDRFNAADGLHPSDAGYRLWYGELQQQAGLSQRLAEKSAAGRVAQH